MHDSNPVEMISGVPVVAAPMEVDATTAEQFRAVLPSCPRPSGSLDGEVRTGG